LKFTRNGLSGLFFPPRPSLVERKMLEVNRIQFTLANHPDPETLADELDALLCAGGRFEPAVLPATYFVPNRFDGVAYAKQQLQHVLQPDLRTNLTGKLFREIVRENEEEFVVDLYLIPDHAREMRASGMELGGGALRFAFMACSSFC
jgi:hypothetical protein